MISDEQKAQFSDQGYLVIPDVVPLALCQQVIDAILSYTGVQLDDRSSLYQGTYMDHGYMDHGIVPMHHHQALWNIRQHPSVHEVFASLYDRESLWVSMDRVSYKPPLASQTVHLEQAAIHWDCDPWNSQAPAMSALSIQGLVYLTDTTKSQGAFSCVPSIYKHLDGWCTTHAFDESRANPIVPDDDLIAVEGSAGSLVVFNRLMPHTSRLNKSANHRFVQYLTMQPVTGEKERLQRIYEWRELMPPAWAVRQNIQQQKIPESGESAVLSKLGRKLVGIDLWPDD
ncbi:MAG: phytanoyl-CoA dioxygenase family protein [Pseudomonadales bacterium]